MKWFSEEALAASAEAADAEIAHMVLTQGLAKKPVCSKVALLEYPLKKKGQGAVVDHLDSNGDPLYAHCGHCLKPTSGICYAEKQPHPKPCTSCPTEEEIA